MKIGFFSVLIILFLVSCSGEEKTNVEGPVEQFGRGKDSANAPVEETVDKVEEKDTIIVDTSSYYGKKLYVFKDFFSTYDTVPANETTLFDRFTTQISLKYTFRKRSTVQYGENRVIPELDVFYYKFSDSVSAHNAIYNWLDCQGDCQQVSIGEEFDAFKSSPLKACFTKNEVLIMKMLCEHKANDWSKITSAAENILTVEPYAIMNVSCGGPLRWVLSKSYQSTLEIKEEKKEEDEAD